MSEGGGGDMEREAEAVEVEAIDRLEEAETSAAADVREAEGEPGDVEVEAARERLDGIIESLLFASSAPLPIRRIVDVLNGPTAKEIKAALARLLTEYDGQSRGIQLCAVAGGYQFRTAPANADYVRALLRERPARL